MQLRYIWICIDFNELADKNITLPITSLPFWLICIGFVAFTGLLAGSYPALYLSSFQPIKVLKGTFKAGKSTSVFRKVLVVLQFTVSVALIISTIVVQKQIQFAKDRNVPICGKDFKTGQTLMKTILAPGFKSRLIGLNGWFSMNILLAHKW